MEDEKTKKEESGGSRELRGEDGGRTEIEGPEAF
jgi:hypothetical protein